MCFWRVHFYVGRFRVDLQSKSRLSASFSTWDNFVNASNFSHMFISMMRLISIHFECRRVVVLLLIYCVESKG
jgi:hypothetical protein